MTLVRTKAPRGRPPTNKPVVAPTVLNRNYRCCMCGAEYSTQRGSFFASMSPLYAGNDNFLCVCIQCVNKMYEDYANYYGDNRKAMRRICERLDLLWHPQAYDSIVESRGVDSVSPAAYIARSNTKQYGGGGFDRTLMYEREWEPELEPEQEPVLSEPVTAETEESDKEDELAEAQDLFGEGFTPEAYAQMLKTYHSYIDPLGKNATAGQAKDAKYLAMLEYRATDAIKTNANNVSAIFKTFQETLEKSGFSNMKQSDGNVEPYGVWLADIENYTPAEFVKKHGLYKDEDGMSYFDRFVVRPLKNLFSKTGYVPDEELSLTEEDMNSEDLQDGDGG